MKTINNFDELTQHEQILIKTVREAKSMIVFILIHLSNLYALQARLDKEEKRFDNAMEMEFRSQLFFGAFVRCLGLDNIDLLV